MIHHLTKHFSLLSETKQRILKNTLWLSVAEIGARVARGGLAIVAARMLGAEGLGVFSYAIALGGLMTFFEDAGIGTFVTRHFAKNTEHRATVLGTALALKILLSSIALLFFVSVGPIVSTLPEAGIIIPIVAILLMADSLRGFFFSITRAEQQMHIESRIQLITNTLIVILGIGFMMINPTALSLVLGYALGSSIGCGLAYIAVRHHIPHLQKHFSKTRFKEIFFAAWPFTILAVSNVLIFNTDTLFLGYYGNTTDVGLYGAASRLVQLFYILPALFAVSSFPTLVKRADDWTEFWSALRKSLLLMISLAIALIIILTTTASFIVPLLFGISFLSAVPILMILSLTYIPIFIGSMLNNAVIAMDLQKKFVIANIAGIIINMTLDIILIPTMGGIGAAIASVAGLSVITLVTIYKLYRTKKTLA